MQSKAPWTSNQIVALNRWQECDHVHPFTCPRHDNDDEVRLVATEKGWRCSKFDCHYEQDWCHDFMLEGPPELPVDLIRIQQVLNLTKEKDGAYDERNRVVALVAAMAMKDGWTVCQTRTSIPGWDPEWENCVYIDSPEGQLSWHFHDRHAHLFEHVPKVASHEWDGHTTDVKYQRIEKICKGGLKDVGLTEGESRALETGDDQEGSSTSSK